MPRSPAARPRIFAPRRLSRPGSVVCLSVLVAGLWFTTVAFSQSGDTPPTRSVEVPAGPGDDLPADWEETIPATDVPDLDNLLLRLESAEAEIRELRTQRDSDLTTTVNPESRGSVETTEQASWLDDGGAAGGPPMSEAAGLADLRKQFEALKSGIEKDKKKFPTVEVHGVFQVDTGWVHQTRESIATVGDIQDGSSFRRARLSANGKVVDNMAYFIQMDFGFFGRPTFTDVWMELNEVPILGNVRVGQWKQPFSLEVVSSFRYTMFAERSLLFQPFAPFRHIALGFYDWAADETATWAASVYRAGNDQFGDSIGDNGNWAFTGRATWLPFANAEGDQYLNLGLGYNYVAYKDRTARFRTIPEYFVGESVAQTPIGTSGLAIPGPVNGIPFFVDTGNFSANHQNLVGTELLYVDGPLTVMSEFNYNFVAQTNGPALGFPGMYAQAGYFLTGEHRPFNRKLAQIDRIQVCNKVGYDRETGCWGWGAWEVAARYSYLNLNDENIQGGQLQDATLGINWYVNNYAKVQFNYVRAFLDNPVHGSSQTDIFGVRGQLDF